MRGSHGKLTGDGFIWRCHKDKQTMSVRKGSYFSGSKLPLSDILDVICFWSLDVKQTTIAKVGKNNYVG